MYILRFELLDDKEDRDTMQLPNILHLLINIF